MYHLTLQLLSRWAFATTFLDCRSQENDVDVTLNLIMLCIHYITKFGLLAAESMSLDTDAGKPLCIYLPFKQWDENKRGRWVSGERDTRIFEDESPAPISLSVSLRLSVCSYKSCAFAYSHHCAVVLSHKHCFLTVLQAHSRSLIM